MIQSQNDKDTFETSIKDQKELWKTEQLKWNEQQKEIKDMDAITSELSKKAVTAESSVKEIAMKAIESSGKMQIISNSKENAGKE